VGGLSSRLLEGKQTGFQTLKEGRQRRCRDHTVRQTAANGGSGDWEGPSTYGRQFDGRHQQWSEQSGGNADHVTGNTNQLTQV